MKHRTLFAGVAASAFLLSASAALAGDPSFGGGAIQAKPSASMSNMTMTVSGPDGYFAKESSSYGAPSVALAKGGQLADGLYTWELSGASSKRVKANPMGLNNGRGDAEREFMNVGTTESGTFRVVGGVVMTSDTKMIEPVAPRNRLALPRNQK